MLQVYKIPKNFQGVYKVPKNFQGVCIDPKNFQGVSKYVTGVSGTLYTP